MTAPVTIMLPQAPRVYDAADQDRLRRLIELTLREALERAGSGGGSADSELLAARQTLQKTTASIAAGAAEDGTLDFSSRAVELLLITSNKKCRVRLYTTSAARAADASRDRSTDPVAGKGVLAEFIFSVATTIPVSPPIFLYNADGTAANSIYYRVDNDESTSTTITLDFVHLDMEPSA